MFASTLSSFNLLSVPFTQSTMAGIKAFSIADPTLWNALPHYLLHDISDIATLKTHLFVQQCTCDNHIVKLDFDILFEFALVLTFYLNLTDSKCHNWRQIPDINIH